MSLQRLIETMTAHLKLEKAMRDANAVLVVDSVSGEYRQKSNRRSSNACDYARTSSVEMQNLYRSGTWSASDILYITSTKAIMPLQGIRTVAQSQV